MCNFRVFFLNFDFLDEFCSISIWIHSKCNQFFFVYFRFSNRDSIILHKKQHNQEKTHFCSICLKGKLIIESLHLVLKTYILCKRKDFTSYFAFFRSFCLEKKIFQFYSNRLLLQVGHQKETQYVFKVDFTIVSFDASDGD